MPGLDDPFSNSRTPHILSRSRTRSTKDPLDTRTELFIGGQSQGRQNYQGFNSWNQQTIDPKNTWFHYGSRQKRNPDVPAFVRAMFRDFDLGGDFHSRQRKLARLPNHESWSRDNAIFRGTFHGYRWPCLDSYQFSRSDWSETLSAVESPTLSDLFTWGGIGIAKTAPTIPESQLLVAMGELAENLPRLPGSQVRKAGKLSLGALGGEYLNYVFGLVPTINDGKDITHTVANADALLAQIRKDEGKQIKRRRTLFESQSTDVKTHRQPQWPYLNSYVDPSGDQTRTCTVTTTTTQKVWFSGTYHYKFPYLLTRLGDLAAYNSLYGIAPTPDLLWELTHWSWLVDWLVTTNSLITNMSTLGIRGVQIHHAYIMLEESKTIIHDNGINSVAWTESSKHRIRASPFGFGFKPGSLNNKQKAILTALGANRWLS